MASVEGGASTLGQPATVARWHREGFRGGWRRRSRRRPGRPRIDSPLRALIRRMAMENRLWGAPRIHGELLKLGVTVSERTMSRYRPDRRTAPSQTWRTCLANHLGDVALASTATSSYARGDDNVVDEDACVFWFRPAPPLRDERAPPVSGRLSTGLLRSARLLTGLSPRITDTAVDAHTPAPARTRRSGGRRNWPQSVRAEVPFVQRLLWPQAQEEPETIRRELDRHRQFWVSLGAIGRPRRRRAPKHLCTGREAHTASDSHGGRSIGEAQRCPIRGNVPLCGSVHVFRSSGHRPLGRLLTRSHARTSAVLTSRLAVAL